MQVGDQKHDVKALQKVIIVLVEPKLALYRELDSLQRAADSFQKLCKV